MSIRQALSLYEQSKDASSSLIQYRQVYADSTNDNMTDAEEWTKRHNETILSWLDSLHTCRQQVAGRTADKDGSDVIQVSEETTNLETLLTNLMGNDTPEGSYEHLTAMYNVSLVQSSTAKVDAVLSHLLPILHKLMSNQYEKEMEENPNFVMLVVRFLFLILDCIIRKHGGDGVGVRPLVFEQNKEMITLTPDEIITWMEQKVLSSQNNGMMDSIWNKDELKFRLHLYKSKLLFLGTHNTSTHDADNDNFATRTRLSRKELKSAMDVHQNKLSSERLVKSSMNDDSIEKTKGLTNSKPSIKGGGGSKFNKSRGGSNQSDVSSVTSVAGGSLVTSTSEGLWNAVSTAAAGEKKGMVATFEGMPHKVTPSATSMGGQPTQVTTVQEKIKRENPDLHVQHEGVLYLKAELECLRGNTTKSLKLCSEARMAGRRSRGERGNESKDDKSGEEEKQELLSNEGKMAAQYDEAIYYNNLALVHHSAGKVHLALHYYSLALNCISDVYDRDVKDGRSHCFWSDGTARPDISPEILSNTSLCAFQAGDFETAYTCMESCMSLAPELFGKRPRCWLRMGQSCIGKSNVFVVRQLFYSEHESQSTLCFS